MWVKLKRQLWEWRGVIIVAPIVAVLVITLRFIGVLQLLEWAAFDQLVCLRPKEDQDSRVVIVGINESDLQKIQRGIVPDIFLAQLITKIKQQKPRLIGLDIYRDLPEEPGHQELVKVYQSTPNLIGIKKAIGNDQGATINPPPELERRGQVAINDLPLDADLKVRRGFLYLTPKDGKTIESLALRLALDFLKIQNIQQLGVPNDSNKFRLGKAIFSPFEANDGGYVRSDASGYQILFNFRGPANSFKTVSMTDVLEDKVPLDLMRDRIVLIGHTAESKNDFFSTPYSSTLVGFPQPTSGVEIHANLTSEILSAALDNRPLIKSWYEPAEWLWIFGWSFVGAILTWQARYTGGVAKGRLRTGRLLLAGGSLVAIAYLFFLQGWWIPVVPPLLALAGSTLAITAYIARTAGEIRKTFGRYLTDEVVAKLLESPEGLQLGGERRKVTIVMSDLRGFSAISERLPPETVVSMLNIYLGQMADVITSYQGTIDEFIGDAILVIFGAPTQREDDAERAVACAIAMQMAMKSVNEQNTKMSLPKIQMGIGINTGEVVVGNIGSSKRAKYAVVGSHVNLTGRIESYTVGGQVLISEATLKEVKSIAEVSGQMNVQPKGFNEPITLYDVCGMKGKYNLFLSHEEYVLVPLKEELPLQYSLVLEDKRVDPRLFKGSLVKLCPTGAEVRLEYLEKVKTNIKLNLFKGTDASEPSGDLYAKVVEASAEGVMRYKIYFTEIPPDVEALFAEICQKVKV